MSSTNMSFSLLKFSFFIFLLMGFNVEARGEGSLQNFNNIPKDQSKRIKSINSNDFLYYSSKGERESKIKIFILISPQCPFCKKIMSEMDCLRRNFEVEVIALYGDNNLLKRDRIRYQYEANIYLADDAFKSYFKIDEMITPQIIMQNTFDFKIYYQNLSCASLKEKKKQFI